jgi:hypothetical protein
VGTDPANTLRRLGFVVLRAAFDPGPLSDEMDRAALDAFPDDQAGHHLVQGTGTVSFRYMPMMCERTPYSLALVDRLYDLATELLGRSVLPGRAKGTWYDGDTGWHRDSAHDITSIGVVAYLEPLHAGIGALRVLPGSHTSGGPLPDADTDVGEALDTEPGDVIVFDEHLIHGSSGGVHRRQWRVDFVVDPRDTKEATAVRAWFDQSIPDERDNPGYDAKRYPSFGPHWRAREQPWNARLDDLGVYRRTWTP